MTQETYDRVKKVVELFRKELTTDAQNSIGEENFEKLSKMIYEMIQEDRKGITNHVEDLLTRLRKEIDTPELGM